MAVQYIPGEKGLGTILGEGLGSGLSQGIQTALTTRLEELNRRTRQQEMAPGLKTFFPKATNEELLGIASLPPKVISEMIKSRQAESFQAPVDVALEDIISGNKKPSFESSQVKGINPVSNMSRIGEQASLLNELKRAGISGQDLPSLMQNLFPSGMQISEIEPVERETVEQKQKMKDLTPGEKALKETKNLEKALQREDLSPAQKARLRQEIEKRSEKYEKEQGKINKDTQAYFDKISAYGEAADEGDKILNRMENLVTKKGGLPFSTFYNLFNKLEDTSTTAGAGFGAALGGLLGAAGGPASPGTIPLGAATGAALGGAIGGLISPVATIMKGIQRQTSPNAEEFEKLSAEFIKGAKNIFGSRITDADLNAFLKMIPTLANTDQGKLAIIKNMKSFNEANRIKSQAMKQIIKEHKGLRPANLQQLVEDRTKEKLDKLASDFISAD